MKFAAAFARANGSASAARPTDSSRFAGFTASNDAYSVCHAPLSAPTSPYFALSHAQ